MTDLPDDGQPIEAIPTEYSGTTFRSRLEADWACTLDTQNILWEYEPEQITLPSGARYLPDFWLPEIGTWLEVKGPATPRREKAVELGKARACRCDGPCACAWPGGEMVLLGWVAERTHGDINVARSRSGYARWGAAHGPSAYFALCPWCGRSQWITLRRPWKCRACRRGLENEELYQSRDRVLPFGSGSIWSPADTVAIRREIAEQIAEAEAADTEDIRWEDLREE
ncbi:hypothetical protein ACGFYT_27520 [Streptomyces sp. NPDC048208]|uniref:hypothetical protein n=1 Tax=Streptomyces sp. NPDC048208 TaxID=3365515 RepID=UPI00371F0599